MKSYYHADTSRYVKRMKRILTITLLPLLLCSVIAVLILFLNFRAFLLSGFFKDMSVIIISAALFAMLICWFVIEKSQKAVKRNSRYTFFDIGSHELVLSRYAGEYIRNGKRIILRRVDVVLLKSLKSAGINRKNGKIKLIAEKGGIRCYTLRSDRLGYHFIDGKLVFDEWWLNYGCYKEDDRLVIPNIFGHMRAENLKQAISEAKKRFDSAPVKKPYVHKEPDFIKRKKALDALNTLNRR